MMLDVPTMAEAGLPSSETSVWIGIFVPPNTPEPIISILSSAIRKAGEDPALKNGFANDGSVVVTDAMPAKFVEFLRQEIDRWVKVVKASGQPLNEGMVKRRYVCRRSRN